MPRFGRLLLLIVLAGLVVRVGYVAFVVGDEPLKGDQVYYTGVANRLAQGHGFVDPYDAARDIHRVGTEESADHPPLTVVTLAPVAWVLDRLPGVEGDTTRGDNHTFAFRLTFALLGCVTVALVGLIGREVGGGRVGLLAAAVAAVYPNLWVNDGLVMAETLTVAAAALVLFLAYRSRRFPTTLTAVTLGAACGLAGLARAEMILLLPCVAIPVLLGHRADWGRNVARVGVAVLATLVVVGPWVVFNLTRFEDPTFLSTNDGQTLLGANCDGAYHGPGTGLWLLSCLRGLPGDHSQVGTESRRLAFEYMQDHAGRVPTVAVVRVARLWNVYGPGDMVWYNDGEGREKWISRLGLWFYYPLAVLALGGVYVLRRSWSRLWPLLSVVGLVTVVGALTYGQMRLRVPAEISVVVLAAVAIDAVIRAVTSSTSPHGDPSDVLPDDRPSAAVRIGQP